MNIEIIDVTGMLPNPLIAGPVHQHKEFILYLDGEQYISLPGLTIKYSIDGVEKEYETTTEEFFYKNSSDTLANYNIFKTQSQDPTVLNLVHLQEAILEYRNNKDNFINRIREYYGLRLS